MPGVHYGTHRSIACIVLVNHQLLMADEIVGKLDDSPLTAGMLAELYNKKKLVVYNTEIKNGKPRPWFDSSKVTSMLGKFELGRMFDPIRDQGIGVHLSTNGGTKFLLQECQEWDMKSSVTAASYIKSIGRNQLNRIS